MGIISQEQALIILAIALGWSAKKAQVVYSSRDYSFYEPGSTGILPSQLGDLIRINIPDRNNSEY